MPVQLPFHGRWATPHTCMAAPCAHPNHCSKHSSTLQAPVMPGSTTPPHTAQMAAVIAAPCSGSGGRGSRPCAAPRRRAPASAAATPNAAEADPSRAHATVRHGAQGATILVSAASRFTACAPLCMPKISALRVRLPSAQRVSWWPCTASSSGGRLKPHGDKLRAAGAECRLCAVPCCAVLFVGNVSLNQKNNQTKKSFDVCARTASTSRVLLSETSSAQSSFRMQGRGDLYVALHACQMLYNIAQQTF